VSLKQYKNPVGFKSTPQTAKSACKLPQISFVTVKYNYKIY